MSEETATRGGLPNGELPLGAGTTSECIIGDDDACSGLGDGGGCPEPVRCSLDWLFHRHGLGPRGAVVVQIHPYRSGPLSSSRGGES